MIERRGRPVARLNLSPSSHLLLFEIEAGSQPPAFRSANTALSSRFSIWSGVRPASGPDAGGSYRRLPEYVGPRIGAPSPARSDGTILAGRARGPPRERGTFPAAHAPAVARGTPAIAAASRTVCPISSA